jgi:hypothetical protein
LTESNENKETPRKSKRELFEEKKAKIEKQLAEVRRKESLRERKQRNQKLIQIGGLVNIAGLTEMDKGLLLGALLEMATTIESNPGKHDEWKHNGDSTLKEREDQRKAGKAT